MLRRILIQVTAGMLLLASAAAHSVSKPINNADVVALTKRGLTENTIIGIIEKRPASFDLSSAGLIQLQQGGVSSPVIVAMLAAANKQNNATSTAASAGDGQTPAATNTAKHSFWSALRSNHAVGQKLSSIANRLASGAGTAESEMKNGLRSGLNDLAPAFTSDTSDANGSAALVSAAPNAPEVQGAPGQNAKMAPVSGGAANAGGTPQKQPASAPATSSAGTQAGPNGSRTVILFTKWRDPREGAFTISVPQDWQISGGTLRHSVMDPVQTVRVISRDRQMQVFLGDADIVPREVPNQMLAFAGMREGQTIKGAWGGPMLLARYQTGEQFARSYASSKVCRSAQITSSRTLQDASRKLSVQAAAYARAEGGTGEAWVGEVTFRCGQQTGYVRASTVLARPVSGPGAQVWIVPEVDGYVVGGNEDPAYARYVLDTMVASVQMDPQWEAQQAQASRQVSGAIMQSQQRMAAAIAEHGREQAQHDQIDVMSGWEKRNQVMDSIMHKDSEVRLGITEVEDPSTGTTRTVSNNSNYYWYRGDGSIVGTMTDTAPGPEWQQMTTH